MPLQKRKPEVQRAATEPIPSLTHQSSLESVSSPITPSHDTPVHPAERTLKPNTTHDQPNQKMEGFPFPNPKTTNTNANTPTITIANGDNSPPLSPAIPPKNLPFLSKDPFAQDDDIIPFDKNKPIVPSRSGSVRSIMSTSSMQSLKRGIGSIKRSLSRSRSKSRARRAEKKEKEAQSEALRVPGQIQDGIQPIGRAGTYMMSNPKRVDTFQVSAMAF